MKKKTKPKLLSPVFPLPVVGGDVPLQVKLTVMKLDHRETSTTDHVDFVHTRDAAFKDGCHEIQDFRWSGSGQINIGEHGIFRAAII